MPQNGFPPMLEGKSAVFLKSAVRPNQYPPPDFPEVAFAGRSNVGKSSLINKLIRRKKLVRTGSKPGHTRTLNFYLIDDALCLVDFPGYGFARVSRSLRNEWRRMIDTYLRVRRNLCAVVLLVDIRREPGEEEWDLLRLLNEASVPVLLAVTKMDKLRGNARRERLKHWKGVLSPFSVPFYPCSAVTGEGVPELRRAIVETLPPPPSLSGSMDPPFPAS